MQDSSITYRVIAAGVEEAEAKFKRLGVAIKSMSLNQDGSVTASGKLTKAQAEQAAALDKSTGALNRASKAQQGYFAHIAQTTVQSALVNQLFLQFVDVAGQAIQAVDLMNNFPATMASMGESTKDATEAMKALSAYVGQVGGNIQQATSMVTRFTGVTKDVKAATAVYTGLNNALIAGDSSAEEQKQALLQFAQAFERGKPDMREWNSLTQNMSFQLALVAKEMGRVNANDLGQALRDGEESMSEFVTTLTKMSTGTGVIAQQTMTRMQGMQFAFNVLKNTLVQGLATIIQTIGRNTIVSFFTFLTQVVIALTQSIVILINWILALVNAFSRLFGGPTFGQIKGDADGIAQGLAAGAGAADAMGDNLDGAKDSAKDLNKTLAGFDKMNVLSEGKKKDSGNQGTQFDASQLASLNDAFDGIGNKLKEAGIAAKIFAGILAGIAGNALISKLFGVNPLSGLIKGLGDAAKSSLGLNKNLKGAGEEAERAGEKASRGFAGKFAEGVSKSGSIVIPGIAGFFTGLAPLIAPAIATAGVAVLGLVDTFILVPAITVIGGLAAALGLPFAAVVAIVAAVIAAIVGIIWLIWTNWDAIWKFIRDAFSVSVDAITATWNTLYDIFSGPVRFIWQFIKAVFILSVAIVATALQLIFNVVVGTVTMMFKVLEGVARWVDANVVRPVVTVFTLMWDMIAAAAAMAWHVIFNVILLPVANLIYTRIIQPISGFFQGMWNGISGTTTGFVSGILRILSPVIVWIVNNIILPVTGFFQNLWSGILSGLRGMAGGIQNIFSGIGEIIKTPINGVIELINIVLKGLNKIKVPDWVPGLGGQSVNFPMIPRLANGGVVQQATMAMIGEKGQEVVMPLENNTEWIDTLASKLNTSSNTSGDTHVPSRLDAPQQAPIYNIRVEGVFATSIAEQRRVADQIMKRIKETQKTAGVF